MLLTPLPSMCHGSTSTTQGDTLDSHRSQGLAARCRYVTLHNGAIITPGHRTPHQHTHNTRQHTAVILVTFFKIQV